MRLAILAHGHPRRHKLVFWMVRRVMGRVPGPMLALNYRAEFFGRPLSRVLQQAMRGAKHWSIGEVELMAAFVSKHNHCAY